jgi:hypothetical protein
MELNITFIMSDNVEKVPPYVMDVIASYSFSKE